MEKLRLILSKNLEKKHQKTKDYAKTNFTNIFWIFDKL